MECSVISNNTPQQQQVVDAAHTVHGGIREAVTNQRVDGTEERDTRVYMVLFRRRPPTPSSRGSGRDAFYDE